MLRDDHQIDAEPIRHAQDRAEVLRVGDAVEDEDELRGVDRLVEVRVRGLGEIGDDAVVHAAIGQAIELLGRQHAHRHARFLRLRDDALHFAAVLARKADVVDALRMRADRLEDGVEAVDDHFATVILSSFFTIIGPS